MFNRHFIVFLLACMVSLHGLSQTQGQPDPASVKQPQKFSPLDNLGDEPTKPQSIADRAKLSEGLIEQRLRREHATVGNPFVITPHRPNFFLPLTYTQNPNDRGFLTDNDTFEALDELEFKFQLSVKFPVSFNVLNTDTSLWFAYTQQAFWQSYNDNISAPFRDTNHEPEAFLLYSVDQGIWGIKPNSIAIGLNHQSNGQAEPISRSWNRVYMDFLFETDSMIISVKPWYRIPEARSQDDNPNIEKYFGYGELNLVHVYEDYSVDIMIRNNLRVENKGAVQVGFTFPAWGKIRGYVQYFNGYGQSLLDYDNKIQSLGVGIMLTNWL